MKLKTAFKLSALTVALIGTNALAAPTNLTDTLNIDISSSTGPTTIGSKTTSENSFSTVVVDAEGTNVNAGKTVSESDENLEGTTLSYDTVIDSSITKQTHDYKDTFKGTDTTESTSQIYTPEKLQFDSKTTEQDFTREEYKLADVNYQNGRFTGIDNVRNDPSKSSTTIYEPVKVVSEDTIIVGRESSGDENALTVRKTDANGTTQTIVTAGSVTTDTLNATNLNVSDLNIVNLSADVITLDGVDLSHTISGIDSKAETAIATANNANTKADTAITTANNANTKADTAITTANNVNTKADTAITTANNANTKADAATLTANDAKTLATDADVKATNALNAIQGVESNFAQVNSRVDQLNSKISDVEKTANRGVAIALAAQQQVPNMGAGQTALYGGVGHYESESAFALGLTTVFGNGRTSLSGAVGVAGGSEVGGRVGIAHVFGGK